MLSLYIKKTILPILRFLLNDKLYYQIRFFLKFKKILNFSNPQTFNAKINYLKLYDRNELYFKLVDKYEVRQFVKEKIGEKYLNKLYGVYENISDLDFDSLPNSFVIKATHGSAWVLICDDKNKFNFIKAKKKINFWLSNNFYELWGEWVYKSLKPRFICEKFLKNKNEASILDYKFYCFNGEPKFVHVDLDRANRHERNFYDLSWKRMPFGLCYPQSKREAKKPNQLKLMIKLAKKLSSDFMFVRVDFYEIKNQVIFGELTFNPGNGLELFSPEKYDKQIGDLLNLDN